MMNKKLKKILIAEDDFPISKIMGYILESDGFEVDKAGDGEEALKKIESNEYAVVLLDLIMPRVDGFDVLKALKGNKNKPPILVFSNLSEEEERRKAFDLGAEGFYVKANISTDEIVDIVKKYT